MHSKFNLEDRLIDFGAEILKTSCKLAKVAGLQSISNQLARSGTSPALNYGEAQAAESRKDFIHKIMIAFKELRETKNSLRIIAKTGFVPAGSLTSLIKECDELIAIFYSIHRKTRQNATN